MHAFLPTELIIVGSVARQEQNTKDIDAITTYSLDLIESKIFSYYRKVELLSSGRMFRKFKIGSEGYKLDVWKTTQSELLFSLLSHLLPKGEVIGLRNKAKKMGLTLNDKGIYNNKKRMNDVRSLDDVLDLLDVKKRDLIYFYFQNVKF